MNMTKYSVPFLLLEEMDKFLYSASALAILISLIHVSVQTETLLPLKDSEGIQLKDGTEATPDPLTDLERVEITTYPKLENGTEPDIPSGELIDKLNFPNEDFEFGMKEISNSTQTHNFIIPTESTLTTNSSEELLGNAKSASNEQSVYVQHPMHRQMMAVISKQHQPHKNPPSPPQITFSTFRKSIFPAAGQPKPQYHSKEETEDQYSNYKPKLEQLEYQDSNYKPKSIFPVEQQTASPSTFNTINSIDSYDKPQKQPHRFKNSIPKSGNFDQQNSANFDQQLPSSGNNARLPNNFQSVSGPPYSFPSHSQIGAMTPLFKYNPGTPSSPSISFPQTNNNYQSQVTPSPSTFRFNYNNQQQQFQQPPPPTLPSVTAVFRQNSGQIPPAPSELFVKKPLSNDPPLRFPQKLVNQGLPPKPTSTSIFPQYHLQQGPPATFQQQLLYQGTAVPFKQYSYDSQPQFQFRQQEFIQPRTPVQQEFIQPRTPMKFLSRKEREPPALEKQPEPPTGQSFQTQNYNYPQSSGNYFPTQSSPTFSSTPTFSQQQNFSPSPRTFSSSPSFTQSRSFTPQMNFGPISYFGPSSTPSPPFPPNTIQQFRSGVVNTGFQQPYNFQYNPYQNNQFSTPQGILTSQQSVFTTPKPNTTNAPAPFKLEIEIPPFKPANLDGYVVTKAGANHTPDLKTEVIKHPTKFKESMVQHMVMPGPGGKLMSQQITSAQLTSQFSPGQFTSQQYNTGQLSSQQVGNGGQPTPPQFNQGQFNSQQYNQFTPQFSQGQYTPQFNQVNQVNQFTAQQYTSGQPATSQYNSGQPVTSQYTSGQPANSPWISGPPPGYTSNQPTSPQQTSGQQSSQEYTGSSQEYTTSNEASSQQFNSAPKNSQTFNQGQYTSQQYNSVQPSSNNQFNPADTFKSYPLSTAMGLATKPKHFKRLPDSYFLDPSTADNGTRLTNEEGEVTSGTFQVFNRIFGFATTTPAPVVRELIDIRQLFFTTEPPHMVKRSNGEISRPKFPGGDEQLLESQDMPNQSQHERENMEPINILNEPIVEVKEEENTTTEKQKSEEEEQTTTAEMMETEEKSEEKKPKKEKKSKDSEMTTAEVMDEPPEMEISKKEKKPKSKTNDGGKEIKEMPCKSNKSSKSVADGPSKTKFSSGPVGSPEVQVRILWPQDQSSGDGKPFKTITPQQVLQNNKWPQMGNTIRAQEGLVSNPFPYNEQALKREVPFHSETQRRPLESTSSLYKLLATAPTIKILEPGTTTLAPGENFAKSAGRFAGGVVRNVQTTSEDFGNDNSTQASV